MKTRAAVTIVAATVAATLGIWGYWLAFPVGTGEAGVLGALDNTYRTLRLFMLEGDPADTSSAQWQLSLARVSAAVAFFGAVIWATFELLEARIRQFHARYLYRGHYIICGAGDRGQALAANLLSQGEKVVLVEKQVATPLLDRLFKAGAVVLHGDATDPAVLQQAGLARAAHVVMLAGTDLVNLEILAAALAAPHKPELHCHVHLARIENRIHFEEKGCFSIERIKSQRAFLTVFNINELAAVALFGQYPLGSNADTTRPDAPPVRILVAGFGEVGYAVMVEALSTGHFCNGRPIQVTVLDPDARAAQDRFHSRHHQVRHHANGQGLRLWDIEFKERIDDIGPIGAYHHVIAGDDVPNEALSTILVLHGRYRLEQGTGVHPRFSFHAPDGARKPREEIEPFGRLADLCTRDVLINTSGEDAARQSHMHYVRSKLELPDASDAVLDEEVRKRDATPGKGPEEWLGWNLQPLFKRRSNVAQSRHVAVKRLAFPASTAARHGQPPDDSQLQAQMPYHDSLQDDVREAGMQLLRDAVARGLPLPDAIDRCRRLAQAEHARWNAFHVLDNWRHGPAKDEDRKTHNCLLDWEQLQAREPGTLEYDYINVYRTSSTQPTP